MKKIAIIGAGNMGSAIARGLYGRKGYSVTVSNRSESRIEKLKAELPDIAVTTNNIDAVHDADIIILAVKPYIICDVMARIAGTISEKSPVIVSIAAGIPLLRLTGCFNGHSNPHVFRAIPNTAISVGKGITFICEAENSASTRDEVVKLFETMGEVAVIEEKMIEAATALCSCGIAYSFKFIQAMTQAGVQLGFTPADALRFSTITSEGAAAILKASGTKPQEEIDRVTTPGGLTIKGINSLEHTGFTASVIDAVIKPLE